MKRGEGIPATREQAYSLIRAVDGDVDRLTSDQVKAIRDLYNLDEYRTVAEALEGGMHL